jgi:hypothetical protein
MNEWLGVDTRNASAIFTMKQIEEKEFLQLGRGSKQ